MWAAYKIEITIKYIKVPIRQSKWSARDITWQNMIALDLIVEGLKEIVCTLRNKEPRPYLKKVIATQL